MPLVFLFCDAGDMSREEDWWTNPWMVALFGVAAVPFIAGVVAMLVVVRSARSQGWDARRILGVILTVGWSVWWAVDWWGRATDSRFHG